MLIIDSLLKFNFFLSGEVQENLSLFWVSQAQAAMALPARTRPMVCFVNVESVDRIIYSIFQRFNLEWKTRTLNLFTQAA
jgi:hypothetical protein